MASILVLANLLMRIAGTALRSLGLLPTLTPGSLGLAASRVFLGGDRKVPTVIILFAPVCYAVSDAGGEVEMDFFFSE